MKKSTAFCVLSVMVATAMVGCSSKGNTNNTESKSESKAESKSDATADQTKAAASNIGNADYVYAKINVPYADYYYGEVNNIAPEENPASLKANLTAPDAVKDLRAAGQYDSVSSVTAQKMKLFPVADSEAVGQGSQYKGVVGVNVAISKSLYEDAKKAIEEKKTSENALLTLVGEMTTTTDTTPTEYKVLNSDGTLSKTVGNVTKDDKAKAEITSTSKYGNYQIDLSDINLDIKNVQGVLLETDDGKKYGLEHLENIWVKPAELAFAVEAFKENHGNDVDYLRYADMQGKTIKKITYLLADADDIEVDTSLYVTKKAPDGYKLTGDEKVNYAADGTKINYKLETADTKYKLSRIVYKNSNVKWTADTSTDGVVALPKEAGPGKYQLIFSSDTYNDLSMTVTVDSGLKEGDIKFENNAIVIADNAQKIDAKMYLNGINSAKVNDTEYKGGKGRSFGKNAFNEDGSVKLDAATKGDDGEKPIFASGKNTVTLKADGYPDFTFEVNK
jgi:hypothetical protein